MSQTTLYNGDVNDDMSLMRWVLRMIGAWPISSSSLSIQMAHRLQKVVTYFLFLLTIVPPLFYAFLKEKNRRVRLTLLGPIFNSSMQLMKYSILLYKMDDIKRIMTRINQEWMNASEWERRILRSKTRVGRKLVLISVIFMFGGGMSYRISVPILKGKLVTADNVAIRPLPCPSYFVLFDEQVTPFYEIIFILQLFCGIISYCVTCGGCGISAFLVLHVCSQLSVLVNKMKELEDKNDSDEDVQRKLVGVIDHQTRTKEFLKQIQEVTEHISFFEVFGSGFMIFPVGFFVIMAWENKSGVGVFTGTLLLISFTFCVFIYCYIGQLLVNESDKVGLTSVTIRWYGLPMKKARYLVLIITTSTYPTKLVAGKLIDLSLDTFVNVVKIVLGYLNILRQVI